MSRSKSYRDNYAGQGEYAKENDAMLDSECARTLDWQKQSAHSAGSVLPLIGLAVLLLASALGAGIYFFFIGDLD
jgi:hypothetical protein